MSHPAGILRPAVGESFSSDTQPRSLRLWHLALALVLALLSLAACSRVTNPVGGSGGTVAGDVLYIGTSTGRVIALDTATGETLWRFELQSEDVDRAIYGTPAVVDDTVYVGGYDGVLYAIATDGELMWQERLGGAIVGGPLVVDDMILVGSSDGYMYAIDIEDQTREWRFLTGHKVWSTPAVADGVVYFGSLDHNLYAVDIEDGTELWHFKTNGAVVAQPVVIGGRVFIGSFDGVFYAVDVGSGTEIWRFEEASNWYWASAIAVGPLIYAPSLDGNLYALDIGTGELRWTLKTEGAIIGSPVVVHDMIAVPSADGKIRLARLRDLSERDACNVGDDIRASLVEHDGSLYFGVRDRSIRALRIKTSGNPDEEWVHFTEKDDPLPRDRPPAC